MCLMSLNVSPGDVALSREGFCIMDKCCSSGAENHLFSNEIDGCNG